MQITSLLNDLSRVASGLALSIAACQMAYAGADCAWKALIGKKAAIEIARKQVRLERSLQARLGHAEAAAFLPLDLKAGITESSWRWLLLRESSRARGGAGFCGAGHEDHLLLVKVTKSVGTVIDEFMAQSCLKSISMDINEFNELVGAIGIDKQAGQLFFRQTVSNENESIWQEVRIKVVSGRMSVSTRRLDDLAVVPSSMIDMDWANVTATLASAVMGGWLASRVAQTDPVLGRVERARAFCGHPRTP